MPIHPVVLNMYLTSEVIPQKIFDCLIIPLTLPGLFPLSPLAKLLLDVALIGEPAYTYSPSTYRAVEMNVVRLSRFV